MRILLEEQLARGAACFDASPERLRARYRVELLDHPRYGRALRFYLLLTEAPGLLEELGADSESVFWSRYYWFLRFVRLHRAVEGYDAGIEQEASQLLEEAEATGHDVRVAETIEAQVEDDILTSR